MYTSERWMPWWKMQRNRSNRKSTHSQKTLYRSEKKTQQQHETLWVVVRRKLVVRFHAIFRLYQPTTKRYIKNNFDYLMAAIHILFHTNPTNFLTHSDCLFYVQHKRNATNSMCFDSVFLLCTYFFSLSLSLTHSVRWIFFVLLFVQTLTFDLRT